jgi:hypothetical protein
MFPEDRSTRNTVITSHVNFQTMDKQVKIVSQLCFLKGSKPQNVVSATKISLGEQTAVSLLGNTPPSLEAKFRPATSVGYKVLATTYSILPRAGRSVAPVS